MNRTTLSLLAGTAALAAVTGFATLSSPQAATTAGTAAELPVERTSLLCPEPSTSEVAETSYTSFTPVTKNTGNDGKAELKAAAEESDGQDQSQSKNKGKGKSKGKKKAAKPVLTPKEPGTPVTGDTSGGDAPALVGTAEGKFAPGWTCLLYTSDAADE